MIAKKGLIVLAMGASSFGALQGQDTPPACTYEECALRIEPGGWFSGSRIVRGADGEEVSDLDPTRDLRSLLASSDSAAAHFAIYARKDEQADWIGRAAMALTLGSSAILIFSRGDDRGWAVGLQFGGLVTSFFAIGPRKTARRELSRALWWYNAGLQRTR